ncbi:SWT1 RNA endoribonuclease homolog [Homo sapiens]|uniref:Transcriptional protein SWT1 n=1 Tax=Homo sapiens TaxID=9606 RepID=SWT1_HUMAN|nr:transcriptional protein SWT1 [Homo sapiens]NP_060143.4 transcriptional protein SWT1 [Homo sapiens]XP_016857016.1 transcriptional protein SWT1 isoform X2 [Homo sapiens]XP_024303522.1 transcriptional protein SWT1 isoform X2 [Homo sapiens]XP_047279199.1 transcriptional protein SWT1 isoform X2 [Homo sapiens]XP_054193187.1 transcriptional protein SWT1 isoform X2 [Homo sapiens]XP_054193188.1 transcriptional protein SWT1 isoform X2 [Homo sapiens]XP_054193189.1 transcriptional protein SWT1 isofor|eukprot:NP_001098988.1 transcriptional protein SWT1 [Homo sapiens]
MSSKESCGKKETSQRKDTTTSSPNFGEKDKKERKTPASSTSSSSIRSVSSEKRKLKSDHTDVLYYNIKRRQGLKRLSVEIDTLRRRPKIGSSSQRPIKLKEASYSNDNQIILQSPSSNGTKKDIHKCVDFKPKDIKLTNAGSKLDHGIKSLSSPKIASDVKPKAEGQASENKWSHLLVQREKMKELKKGRNSKFRDNSEKCVLEKWKRNQFSQDYNSNKIIKEPLGSRRQKISFKIPIKSRDTLQKLVEENVFNIDSNNSKTKQEEREYLESSQVSLNVTRQKTEHLLSDFTYKRTVHEWKRKHHYDHQESNDSHSRENLTQSFEAPCCSVSSESIQDADQEMQIVEELHAARVGKSVDLPGELMSMEIDLEDDVHSSSANNTSDRKLLIVIDTNILMNHLKFVRILKTTEVPGFDKLVLIIPWVVMQELDRMKEGKLLKRAQHKAIPAVHFINDSLKNQDRKLWGQSIQLASQKHYGLSDENNDDRVLKCCLQHQELFPCSFVILCTDDRNLRNKGLISGVKSLSKEELSAELLHLSLNTDVCHQPCIPKQQLKAETTPLKESYKEESTNSGLSILLESIVSDLEKSLGTGLSSILETEMKIAFGNLWMEILYLKPPWTLLHLLQCFKKHWLAVFGLVMEKNLLLTIESLYKNLRKANKAVDFTTVKFLLQDSRSLLHAFSTRSNYDGILPQTFAQVNNLLQTFAEVKTKLKPNSSENTVTKKQEGTSLKNSHNQEITVFSSSHLPQPSRHQEIWSILESVWITIYQNSTDVFQRLGSNSALTTSNIASFEEAFICLQKLMAAVRDILEGIQRILAPNSNYQDVETLYNFLIKYEVNKNVKFTAQEIYDCVSQTEYREKLTIGCRQLVEMEYTMQQCNASVYMEAKNRGWCEDMLNYRI